MFSPSLRSSFIALIASAITVSATPGLTVWTSTSNPDVYGLENLRVTTTVTNTGDETLQLLNTPRSVLDSFPEDSFSITDSIGSRPEFIGARALFNPEHAVSLDDDPNAFTVLTPGASIDVTHDLSAAYNFTLSGPGQYSIEPSNLFTYVDFDGTLKDLYATVEDAPEVNLSGSLAVSRVHDQRFGFIGCTAPMRQRLAVSAPAARSLAIKTYSYIRGISHPTRRYITWFGPYVQARKNLVQNHFRLISSRNFASFTYDCTSSGMCTSGNYYAYVYPTQFGKIYLCSSFWNYPTTGGVYNHAGMLIHETSHFNLNGGTRDYVYTQAASQNLARTNPGQAVMNADNHMFFAVNVPALPLHPDGDLPQGALDME